MIINNLVDRIVKSTLKNKNNTIIVLKGFEFSDFSFNLQKFFKIDLNNETKILKSKKSLVDEIMRESDKVNFILSYSDLVVLDELKILGLLETINKEIVLIDVDIFNDTYLEYNKNKELNQILASFNDETDNLIVKIFSNIELINEILVYSYNDLNFKFSKIISVSKILKEEPLSKTSKGGVFDLDIVTLNKNDFSSKIHNLFYDYNISSININTTEIKQLDGLKNIIENLNGLGYKINLLSSKITKKADSLNEEAYLDILKRLDKTFVFKNLDIYDDPDSSNKTLSISQMEIIDEIYHNAIYANENKDYRDTFVTSPTGSGKSIMFQIPAILLAEKHNLLTIVVSPLIALMNDQIANITKITDKASTINSDYTPIEVDEIKEKVISGEKSILYISPETLLSNTDISNLIGNRKIGLIVIDESHIVSTWGKSFRPDYWYLGEFLRRLRKTNPFPIAAFTATATYGGDEDMVFDIMGSLHMTVSKPFIGKVLRDNIEFEITNNSSDMDYLAEKNSTVFKRIEDFKKTNDKTLVYFPYKSTIKEFYDELPKDIKEITGKYYGDLEKLEKTETLELFRDGEKKIVLASKAFGMGVDINDIKNVYHYAPTGNLADYVQEIGRAARKKGMKGLAITDYFKQDFKFIKQLFGMSSIKNYEVIGVANKIKYLYKKENKKNILVSPEEFSHIFKDADEDEIDNKLKTTLLILKKDFENNKSLNRYTIIFKPRSMFTIGYFLIPDEEINFFKKIDWFRFLKLTRLKENLQKQVKETTITYSGDIYELDFRELWLNKFRDLSFAQFKRKFFNNELKNLDINGKIISKLSLTVTTDKNFEVVTDKMLDFLFKFEEELDSWKNANKHFDAEEFATKFFLKINNQVKTESQLKILVDNVLMMIYRLDIKGENNFNINNFLTINKLTGKYNLTNTTYKKRFSILKQSLRANFFNDLKENKKLFIENNTSGQKNKMRKNPLLVLVQIMELLDIAKYEIKAGDKPQYFIRINSETGLNKISSDSYYSKTVESVKKRHDNSIRIMEYFFTKLSNNDDRWRLIEEYFLGKSIVDIIE
jgi:ATP-dependent DNA helicase RecQ